MLMAVGPLFGHALSACDAAAEMHSEAADAPFEAGAIGGAETTAAFSAATLPASALAVP
jgi:hypothetical protein